MDFLTDWLTDWLKELLIGGIMGNLEGLFDYVNTQVGEIAVQVGTTPAAWNAGVFSLIRQLSETVILPIAGLVLTFVATYELIQMLLGKNNMHEFDVANIYKWIFKTACAIFILSNTFNIVMAVFDVSQTVIAQAGGLIQGSTDITPDMMTELETTLEGRCWACGSSPPLSALPCGRWASSFLCWCMAECWKSICSPVWPPSLWQRSPTGKWDRSGRTICAPCLPWASKDCSFWCVLRFMRC